MVEKLKLLLPVVHIPNFQRPVYNQVLGFPMKKELIMGVGGAVA